MSNELADRLEAWLAMSGLGVGSSGDTVREAIASLRSEPVAWFHNNYGEIELSRIKRVGWEPLYAAPSRETAKPEEKTTITVLTGQEMVDRGLAVYSKPSRETDQRECSPAPVDEHGLTELRSGAPTPTAEPALSAEEIAKARDFLYSLDYCEVSDDNAQRIAAYALTARDEGIEAAAKWHDDKAAGFFRDGNQTLGYHHDIAAKNIRSLKGQP